MRMVSYKGEIEMKNILTNDFASELFDLSEDSIYNILEEFNENQNIDKTLTYVFIKAFYIHIAKVILDKENISLNFDEVYSKYRMYLSIYYKSNNSQISQELLVQDTRECFISQIQKARKICLLVSSLSERCIQML